MPSSVPMSKCAAIVVIYNIDNRSTPRQSAKLAGDKVSRAMV